MTESHLRGDREVAADTPEVAARCVTRDCVLRGEDRLPLAHMQIRMKSTGKHDWTLLLRARPMPHPEPESTSLPGASASIEEQERLAKSKLERLAAELRALGIQF